MVSLVMSHEVKNYSEWKKGFDADATNRSGMGVKITGVYQSVENPNMISVFSEVPSLEAIKGFLANPELKSAMENAGVIGMPNVKVLSTI